MRSARLSAIALGGSLVACFAPDSEPATGEGGDGGDGGAATTSASGLGAAAGTGGLGGTDAVPVACERGGDTCGRGSFCDFPNDCGLRPGTCAPIPTSCGAGGLPVCGCDGALYASACDAYAAGVDVSADTTCGAVGPSCPCGDTSCNASTEYCESHNIHAFCKPLPAQCGLEDPGPCSCLDAVPCVSAPGPPACMKAADGCFYLECVVTE